MDQPSSIGKAIFYFFAALPYKLFQIGYFVFSFPRRMRRRRKYQDTPKEVVFRRIHGVHTVLSAVDAVHALRDASGQIQKRPSLFDLLEDLWNEDLSDAWKLPSVTELVSIRQAILSDLDTLSFAERPVGQLLIWAIDDDSHMFALFNPYTGKASDLHPEKVRTVLRGEPPDSKEKHVAYAVSVRIAVHKDPQAP